MAVFERLSSESSLSDVLKKFPRNSERLLRLLDDIMCADGELSRGEREAIAAFVSKQNTTQYCVFYHTVFSEVFSGPIDDTNRRIKPLLDYARCLRLRDKNEIGSAFELARQAGWGESALYEVVEVCGIFDFINTIVLASGIETPDGPMRPYPTVDSLKNSYASMADEITN